MTRVQDLHDRALGRFGSLVHRVRDDQWTAPTPCAEWDVHALVNHVVVENLWVEPLFAGQTIADVGDRLDGDHVGEDPVAAWDASAGAASTCIQIDGAMLRTVQLSMGPTPGEEYARQLFADLAIHGWDLARGIGADETMDPQIVDAAWAYFEPQAEAWRAGGAFAAPVEVPVDADLQTRLLAITGRRA